MHSGVCLLVLLLVSSAIVNAKWTFCGQLLFEGTPGEVCCGCDLFSIEKNGTVSGCLLCDTLESCSIDVGNMTANLCELRESRWQDAANFWMMIIAFIVVGCVALSLSIFWVCACVRGKCRCGCACEKCRRQCESCRRCCGSCGKSCKRCCLCKCCCCSKDCCSDRCYKCCSPCRAFKRCLLCHCCSEETGTTTVITQTDV